MFVGKARLARRQDTGARDLRNRKLYCWGLCTDSFNRSSNAQILHYFSHIYLYDGPMPFCGHTKVKRNQFKTGRFRSLYARFEYRGFSQISFV